MKRHLSHMPSEHLNSRQIAKILTSVMGGLAGWNHLEDLAAAIDFIYENKAGLLEFFAATKPAVEDPEAFSAAIKQMEKKQ